MNRLAVGSLEIALMLGCSVGPALAWGPPPGGAPPNIGTLVNPPAPPMVYPDDNSTDKSTQKSADKSSAKKPAAAPVAEASLEKKPAAKSPIDQAAALREQEMQTLLRRQKVCLQLMQIAEETNDPELQRKAEQLDQRAREIYTQRTANLPVAITGGFEPDEHALDKGLSPTAPADRGAAIQPRTEEVQP